MWDPRVKVMFQRTAYADANFTERYGNEVMIPSIVAARAPGEEEEDVCFSDNLAGQKEPRGPFMLACQAAGISIVNPPGNDTQNPAAAAESGNCCRIRQLPDLATVARPTLTGLLCAYSRRGSYGVGVRRGR